METSIYIRNEKGVFLDQKDWKNIHLNNPDNWFDISVRVRLKSDSNCIVTFEDNLLAIIRNLFLFGAKQIMKRQKFQYQFFSYYGSAEIEPQNDLVNIKSLDGCICEFDLNHLLDFFINSATLCLKFVDDLAIDRNRKIKTTMAFHSSLENEVNDIYNKYKAFSNTM